MIEHIGMGIVAPRNSTWLPPAPFEGPSGYVAPGKIGGVAMTEHDIADTIRAFAEAATQAKTLGFDAVEISHLRVCKRRLRDLLFIDNFSVDDRFVAWSAVFRTFARFRRDSAFPARGALARVCFL